MKRLYSLGVTLIIACALASIQNTDKASAQVYTRNFVAGTPTGTVTPGVITNWVPMTQPGSGGSGGGLVTIGGTPVIQPVGGAANSANPPIVLVATAIPTNTATITPTPTVTNTPLATNTATPTFTNTPINTPTNTPLVVNASGVATPGTLAVINAGTSSRTQQIVAFNLVLGNSGATTVLAALCQDGSANNIIGVFPVPPGLSTFSFGNDFLHNAATASGASYGVMLQTTPGPSSPVSYYANTQRILF